MDWTFQVACLSAILFVAKANATSSDELFPSEEQVVVTNTAMGARCSVAADLNGDGRLDIITASSNDNAVSWFE